MVAGDLVQAPLHVANDGPPLPDVVVELAVRRRRPNLSVEELAAVDVTAFPPTGS